MDGNKRVLRYWMVFCQQEYFPYPQVQVFKICLAVFQVSENIELIIFPEALGLSLDMDIESTEFMESLGQVDMTWVDEEHLSI